MKRAGCCFILGLLFLVLTAQQSYADKNPSIDRMGERSQEPCLTIIPPPAPGWMGKMAEMPGGKHPHWLLFHDLDLDDKQKEALKEIENTTLKELIKKRADEQIAEIELHELLDQETVDLKAVEVKLKQIAVIKSESQLTVIRSTEKMKAKLTLEQHNKLRKAQQISPGQRPFRQKDREESHPTVGGKPDFYCN